PPPPKSAGPGANSVAGLNATGAGSKPDGPISNPEAPPSRPAAGLKAEPPSDTGVKAGLRSNVGGAASTSTAPPAYGPGSTIGSSWGPSCNCVGAGSPGRGAMKGSPWGGPPGTPPGYASPGKGAASRGAGSPLWTPGYSWPGRGAASTGSPLWTSV